MALDTAAKRASAINVGSPWRSILPFPDGTVDDGDRATAIFLYSGIAADEPGGGGGDSRFLLLLGVGR